MNYLKLALSAHQCLPDEYKGPDQDIVLRLKIKSTGSLKGSDIRYLLNLKVGIRLKFTLMDFQHLSRKMFNTRL